MGLDKNDAVPLYIQLKNLLERQINRGELKPEEKIASERKLCIQYNVSRITVRNAIALAIKENLLYREHGRGTFVKKQKIKQQLDNINNFNQTLAKQGFIATTIILKSQIIQNTFQLSKILNNNMMEKVKNIQLVGLGNDDPIVYYDSYFPFEFGEIMYKKAVEAIEEEIPFSTLDLYGRPFTLVPTHCEQVFESVAANEYIANVLKIKAHSPILLVTSIVYANKQPLEYKKAYYRGDQYKFFTTRIFDPAIF